MTSLCRITASGAAVALLLVAAACGDDSSAGSAATTVKATTVATAAATTAAATTAAATTAAAAPTTTAKAAGVDKTGWPKKLTIGAVPAENATDLKSNWDPIMKMLSKELGVEVEFVQATDYAGIVEAQIANKVDIAMYGPCSYYIAKVNGAKIEPSVAQISKAGGTPGYYSYGIAKGDSSIAKIDDFKGKKVCFVDPGSTSGFLYPSAGLLAAGIDPKTGVTPVFAGGHDAAALSVKNGTCEAGFAFDDMVDKTLPGKGDLKPGDIKVVWKSELISASPMAVRTALPESLRTTLQRLMLEKGNKDALLKDGYCTGECKLDSNAYGWVKVQESTYDGIRKVCEITKSDKCKSK
ncbi:MAG: phosphate/phosphite/phosphonate ABC transporter substrate-binding protein [Acidimicrobiales bacterium]